MTNGLRTPFIVNHFYKWLNFLFDRFQHMNICPDVEFIKLMVTLAFFQYLFETLIRRLIAFCFSPVSQFNFVGKLLGPRGNSMKRLQEETGVKMSILGKGSMRDKGKVRHIALC